MGRFTIRSRLGHCYIFLVLHCGSNTILVEPFQSCRHQHHIVVYSCIMMRLHERGHAVDLQGLDNKASKEYRQVITKI